MERKREKVGRKERSKNSGRGDEEERKVKGKEVTGGKEGLRRERERGGKRKGRKGERKKVSKNNGGEERPYQGRGEEARRDGNSVLRGERKRIGKIGREDKGCVCVCV